MKSEYFYLTFVEKWSKNTYNNMLFPHYEETGVALYFATI